MICGVCAQVVDGGISINNRPGFALSIATTTEFMEASMDFQWFVFRTTTARRVLFRFCCFVM